ncbi:MAG: triose-phosphate isomerase [Alphaproteobacteria bacterium]|nr:triose-phosphate isomerase [Alphaproteobacteria bacterium]
MVKATAKAKPSKKVPATKAPKEARLPPLIAGNWKMNGLRADLKEARAVAKALAGKGAPKGEVALCPPATLLMAMADALKGSRVILGAQDCHAAQAGAHTGDISAAMLKDAGARFVIIGHSERRADHGEHDDVVRAKAIAALSAGLTPIVCVGETEAERDAGWEIDVVVRQLNGSLPAPMDPARLVIAYEPVWAIGTGRTPTAEQIRLMHAAIHASLADLVPGAPRVRVLYGGSVKPGNADEILGIPGVDGALIGGASLKATDLIKIVSALNKIVEALQPL